MREFIKKSKTALGIDISNNCLNMALLRSKNGTIELVNSVQVPMPQGIVHNGRVEDPIALAKIIRQTKSANKLSSHSAAISLCAEPSLLQILELPKSSPANLRKYIQDEVRQYAILPLKNIDMDFCGLRSLANSSNKPVLVSAAQVDNISLTVRDLEKEKINLSQIEPAVLASIRACFKNVITQNKANNILLVLIKDDTINLCVLKNQNIEFLRTKKIDSSTPSHNEFLETINEEIISVIQYYELDIIESSPQWNIFITDSNNANNTTSLIEELSTQLSDKNVVMAELTKELMDIEIKNDIQNIPSSVAVGLALKILTPTVMPFGLNLLPKDITEMHKAKREILIVANIAAIILLLIFLRIGALTKKINKTDSDVTQNKQIHIEDTLQSLLRQRADINKQVTKMELNVKAMENATGSNKFINWAKVLSELGAKVPNTIRINNISAERAEPLQIKGIAVSNESVNSFVKSLSSCNTISTATLIGINQSVTAREPVDYSINCELK